MTSENLSVGGVRFRTRADYEAALRDQKKIDEIKREMRNAAHRLEFERDGGIEALDRERAEAAHPEILRQYAIPHDRKL